MIYVYFDENTQARKTFFSQILEEHYPQNPKIMFHRAASQLKDLRVSKLVFYAQSTGMVISGRCSEGIRCQLITPLYQNSVFLLLHFLPYPYPQLISKI